MQLFVGVVIENFNRMKEKLDGTFLLSTSQREWLLINEAMLNLKPLRKNKPPTYKFRRLCFEMAQSTSLEMIIMACILMNTLIMALNYFGEEDLFGNAIDYSNYFFAMIFILEALIKLIGLGKYYWKDPWNLFDFVIIWASIFGFAYTLIGGSSVGAAATTIRSLRIGKLFRLIQSTPSLRQMFNTLLMTVPSLVNIGGLLFLVFFIYAAMGVQLFAKVQYSDLVSETTNFQSISKAMVTLIRCSTGERWNDLMYELSSQENCIADPPFNPQMCGFSSSENEDNCIPLNGCGTPVAYVYFITFTLLVSFILLNIFIAVILEGFASEKNLSEGVLLPENYHNFTTTWAFFDPEATGFIEWHCLPRFLQMLDPPMGFGQDYKATTKELNYLMEVLEIPIYKGNKVFFNDVARRLGKFVLDKANSQEEDGEERLEKLPSSLRLAQKWQQFLQKHKIKKQDRSIYRVNHFQAAVLLHRAVDALTFRQDLKLRILKDKMEKQQQQQRAKDKKRRRSRKNLLNPLLEEEEEQDHPQDYNDDRYDDIIHEKEDEDDDSSDDDSSDDGSSDDDDDEKEEEEEEEEEEGFSRKK
jgi:hypothetical protein